MSVCVLVCASEWKSKRESAYDPSLFLNLCYPKLSGMMCLLPVALRSLSVHPESAKSLYSTLGESNTLVSTLNWFK